MVLSSRRRGVPCRVAGPAITFCLVGSLGVSSAGAAPETAVGAAADPLPIRDVVLFSSGVGYFQRDGSIANAADIPLTFPAAEVQDILKSLILIDPAGPVQPV
ncbi:MAG: hypothetical protein LC772_03475, partial [Chloroflexi bacterium]|nr:hypothetical protein [Chloroflexota bacterium]